ncbi:MAG: type II toxin-antitoxin system VapB family antitoxin [Oscillospiraceae bacterium]|nr:type II toxin-antitoxin system VapB family antitoxin [Oscillospiraceae bacterium]
MVKTTINIDKLLLERATKIHRGKTRTEIITIALTEFVERHEQKDLYDIFESDEQLIADDYDYKATRGGAIHDIG